MRPGTDYADEYLCNTTGCVLSVVALIPFLNITRVFSVIAFAVGNTFLLCFPRKPRNRNGQYSGHGDESDDPSGPY